MAAARCAVALRMRACLVRTALLSPKDLHQRLLLHFYMAEINGEEAFSSK